MLILLPAMNGVRYDLEGYSAMFCVLCRDVMAVRIYSIFPAPLITTRSFDHRDRLGFVAACPRCEC